MPIPTVPTPYVRAKSFEIDDEPTFTAPQLVSFNAANGKWTISTFSFHVDQADALATAIERLYQQDFSGNLELTSMEVDAALAGDGVTVLGAAFNVTLQQVDDLPGNFQLGGLSISAGMAWSLATLIREDLGIGAPWTP